MEDQELNNISKKLFENYTLQRPPENFTDKLMLRIEQAKNPVKEEKQLFGKKFILFFTLTFSVLIGFGFAFQDKSVKTRTGFLEKLNLPEFNFEKIMHLFNFNFEISMFAKLIIASIIILVIIDMLTGSLIDYILDSKAKK